MGMLMKGNIELPAKRPEVWAALNDPAILKACIPGCQTLDKTSDVSFAATAKLKIGPVTATFKGHVTLSDINAPFGYRISGEGEGGVAGFAKGSAEVVLSETPDGGTLVSYDVQAQVGGKIAQLGSRLIDSVAKKTADAFFGNLVAVLQDEPAPCI